MLPLTEICRRAQTGPRMQQESFDLDAVYATARKLCEQYDIVYDPANPVPSDDDLADRVYRAAVDFVAEVGVYCPDTGRVVRFTRHEATGAIANAPGRCLMGEGKDRRLWTPRKPDSNTRPWYHVGTGIVNTDQRIALNLVAAYAAIDRADSLSVPALQKIDGQPIISGTPTEILGALRAIQIARDAMRLAGRPGLAIGNCIAAAGTALGTIAASGPQFGLRPSDGWLVGAKAEMKLDFGALNKAAYLGAWGANIGNESGPLMGGYAGGPAAVALLDVAYRIVGRLALKCDYHLTFPIHITKGCSTTRDVIWPAAVSAQAISRNTRELVWSLGYIAAGPMTRQFFHESAAYLAAVISSGVSAQTCHPARAVKNDHVTPMEIRGSVEINRACVGISRSEANQLVKRLLPHYEDRLADAPAGKRYQDCYDVDTGEPCQEYVELYAEVKDELGTMGLRF